MRYRGQLIVAARKVAAAQVYAAMLACFVVAAASAASAAAQAVPAPRSAVTRHSGEFGGVKLSYSAWVEDNFVNDSHGKPGASIITVAYTRDGVADTKGRPVLFAFNGGPGAAGSMLNLSGIGPVRLVGGGQVGPGVRLGLAQSASYHDNPDSLLDA
ncbi:MAG: hypothetical protein ACRET2_02905, partial [Steroidobacteraceae bacterium]